MSKIVLQKKDLVKDTKCIECRKRDATKEDQLCDRCRFMLTIENIITPKQ